MKLKLNLSKTGIILLFCGSLFNKYLILLFLMVLLFIGTRNIAEAINGLILIAIRTILNPQIAIDISVVQNIKWICIFLLSGYIFIKTIRLKRRNKINNSILLVIGFAIYIVVISIYNSCYPVVSIFKCFSYSFVFICIILGIDYTRDKIDWLNRLYIYLTILFFLSILLSPFSFSYYSSAKWFMGITNQSQMFAIMAVLYLSILLYRMVNGYGSFFQTLMMCAVFFLTFLSGARTGIISASIIVFYALYIEIFKNKNYEIVVILFIGIFIILISGYGDEINDLIRNALLKVTDDDSTATVTLDALTRSRYKQFLTFKEKFANDYIFGSGFMVPFVHGVKEWTMSFNFIVENGNLFYSVLGDIGIIGLIFFLCCYGYIFLKGNKSTGKIIIFIAPFLICMGEMVFFSTNNNAIILYVMLAYYLCN